MKKKKYKDKFELEYSIIKNDNKIDKLLLIFYKNKIEIIYNKKTKEEYKEVNIDAIDFVDNLENDKEYDFIIKRIMFYARQNIVIDFNKKYNKNFDFNDTKLQFYDYDKVIMIKPVKALLIEYIHNENTRGYILHFKYYNDFKYNLEI
ncbi:MAG: hypothetical protein QXY70_01070 [Nanopusillaceae archaeon]